MTEERAHEIRLFITEEDARALLRGQVTESVRAMARCAVDWEWTLAKAIARPVARSVRRATRPRRRTRA